MKQNQSQRDESKLRFCEDCGTHSSVCGRMIHKDGSIWPARDTGFRFTK